jgi:DNA integrity scanning protein DisA with diadenylate cyclase activity
MPNWTVVLQWGIPALLTAIGIFFTWRNWNIGRRDQLKLHFYDKRRAMYDAIMEFVVRAEQQGTVTKEDLRSLIQRTKEAPQLFDRKINALILKLGKEGANAIIWQDVMEKGTSPHHKQIVLDWQKRMLWFTELRHTLPAQFDRYLKIKK